MHIKAIILCVAVCTSASAQAGEREWQPAVAGVLLLHQPTEGVRVPGAGVELAAAYGVSEWLAVGPSLAILSMQGIARLQAAATTTSYDAMRIDVGPNLRLSPPQTFLPRHLGDLIVPSLAIGAGIAVEQRANQRLHRGPIVLRRDASAWVVEPRGWATVGIELRPFRRLAVDIYSKYSTPLTSAIGDRADVSIALAVSLFLYP